MKYCSGILNLAYIFLFIFLMLFFIIWIEDLNDIKNDPYYDLSSQGKTFLVACWFGVFFSITLIMTNFYYFVLKIFAIIEFNSNNNIKPDNNNIEPNNNNELNDLKKL